MIEEALRVARRAAAEAGQIMLAGLLTERRVSHKSRFDLVTQVDRQCEEAILAILREACPEATILAEESQSDADRDADLVWLVDPLDGTTNYAHGYPSFCCTLALRRAGVTELGLIYDPLLDERFEAKRGQGAWLNDQAIQVSGTQALDQALLSTGFPADRCDQPLTNLDRHAALTMRTRGVRRGGSAALDLCYVASGRLDGYWEHRIFPWDVVAGALLVEEAGGRVTRTDGGPFDGSGADTCASNGRLHNALIASLAEPLAGGPVYG